ncbi:MAG: 4Fe-4S dicluster domain-containing protein, partial [Candidatus Omnitrophica bacterium]|nr:4Fe-4S dicluster domain-containing protein [Candidatus Omnitrophota bacterium]
VTKPVTIQYPKQPTRPSSVHKGRIRFVIFPATGTHDCIACLKCQNICPSYCFEIKGEKPAGGGQKRPNFFTYNFSTCSLCSLCLEVCPTKTLEHSPEFNLAGSEKSSYFYDFLKDTEERKNQAHAALHR